MALHFRSFENDKYSKRVVNIFLCVVFALLWANVAHSAHVGFVDDHLVEVDCSVCHFGGHPPPETLSIPATSSVFEFVVSNYQSIHLLESPINLNAPLRAPPHS